MFENSEEIKKASQIVFDELMKLSKEELEEFLKPNSPRCEPDTCQGECQGNGWCYICEDFHGELTEDYMEELMG